MNATNPYAPPRAAVRDISGSESDVEPAGRGTRLVTAFLDGIIFAAMVYAPLILVAFFTGLLGGFRGGGRPAGHIVGVGAVFALIGLAVWIWLTVLFVTRNGQSIGKKLMGIKVVRKDGSPVSLGRIFWLRNVVNTVLSIVPLYGLVDALLIFSESRQCLHDRLADTLVIKA